MSTTKKKTTPPEPKAKKATSKPNLNKPVFNETAINARIKFIEGLEDENKLLREKLRQYEQPKQEPMQQLNKVAKMDTDPSSLDILTNQFEEQVSRYCNAMNRLDQLAEKLKSNGQGEQSPKGAIPALPEDWIGKLNYSMDSFNYLNNRLEAMIHYLQKVI